MKQLKLYIEGLLTFAHTFNSYCYTVTHDSSDSIKIYNDRNNYPLYNLTNDFEFDEGNTKDLNVSKALFINHSKHNIILESTKDFRVLGVSNAILFYEVSDQDYQDIQEDLITDSCWIQSFDFERNGYESIALNLIIYNNHIYTLSHVHHLWLEDNPIELKWSVEKLLGRENIDYKEYYSKCFNDYNFFYDIHCEDELDVREITHTFSEEYQSKEIRDYYQQLYSNYIEESK